MATYLTDKDDEPGVGSIVKEKDGTLWIRGASNNYPDSWGNGDSRTNWPAITAKGPVEVVSLSS